VLATSHAVLLMKTITSAVAAAISKPPSDRKRPPGRPSHTWLRAIESDLKSPNIGPSYSWKKAASREHWHSIVDTATLKKSMPRRQSHFRRVAGKLFETRSPVLPQHSFSRRKWHASVEQRVSCRHVEISVHYFKKRSGNQLRTF